MINIYFILYIFMVLEIFLKKKNHQHIVLQTQDELCSSKPFFQFSRIYFLELMSHYYERFHEDVLELNKKLAENFKN
ncbi:motility accessory factor [Campylobacter jejuni subsp. jejuni CG8421]|nr:motility accessory factor [Campylobacter jejuni subsp. jejuni CG8421]